MGVNQVFRSQGVRGFFRGAIASHCIDLIKLVFSFFSFSFSYHPFFSTGLVSAARPVTHRTVNFVIPDATRLMVQPPTFGGRFFRWYRSTEGREMIASMTASLIASSLTYPLRTINLRRIAYEPFDGAHLGVCTCFFIFVPSSVLTHPIYSQAFST